MHVSPGACLELQEVENGARIVLDLHAPVVAGLQTSVQIPKQFPASYRRFDPGCIAIPEFEAFVFNSDV